MAGEASGSSANRLQLLEFLRALADVDEVLQELVACQQSGDGGSSTCWRARGAAAAGNNWFGWRTNGEVAVRLQHAQGHDVQPGLLLRLRILLDAPRHRPDGRVVVQR